MGYAPDRASGFTSTATEPSEVHVLRPQYGDGLYFGVMAKELLPVLPEAVSIDAQGYYAVDYALLDEAAGLQA